MTNRIQIEAAITTKTRIIHFPSILAGGYNYATLQTIYPKHVRACSVTFGPFAVHVILRRGPTPFSDITSGEATMDSESAQVKLARRPSVAAFDFDGTITHRDTFIPFLYRVCGVRRTLQSFLFHSPQAGLVAGGFASRDQLKESIIYALLRGRTRAELHRIGREHAEEIIGWCRPSALARMRWHAEAGHRLVLVSASLDAYLFYIAKELGFDDLLCTRLAYDSAGVSDGRIVGKNCRGPEKVVRINELLGDPSGFRLYAYGDSEGDKELLAIADEPFYRPFHTG